MLGSISNLAPNEGFKEDRIDPIEGYQECDQITDELNPSEEVIDHESTELTKINIKSESSNEFQNDEINVGLLNSSSDIENYNSLVADHDHNNFTENKTSSITQDPSIRNPEYMNNLLQVALFRCLKYIIRDSMLPILTSTLWSEVLR
jgi:G3E family GTPase